MFRNRSLTKTFFSSLVLASISLSTIFVFPQDIIASDDITGGSSVFVFRKSRKEPQEKAAGRAMRASSASGRAGRSHYDSQVAANRKKRVARAKANQAQLAKNRAQQRNAKIATSNTLTAKAETQLDAKQVDQAIATYREALKDNPKNEDAASGLSDALVAKGIDVAG
jgi:tetratricopeptide (TPR) repeat protein